MLTFVIRDVEGADKKLLNNWCRSTQKCYSVKKLSGLKKDFYII